MKQNKKSPLKAKPLRVSGQSVQEEINDLIDDKMLPWFIMALVSVVLAGLEWYRAIFSTPPAPTTYSIVAAFFVLFAALKIIRGRKRLDSLKLGRDGERAVAQYLEGLRTQGFSVFHDIVGEDFNLDHVLIGPQGIFTIETKTISKPARGETKIQYDGQSVWIQGFKPDRDPIVQAKAQAGWLKELLKDSTGKDTPIRPVVVYPGWYISSPKSKRPDVWVLNPKALPTFLSNEPEVLDSSDRELFSYHLSRHIRTTD